MKGYHLKSFAALRAWRHICIATLNMGSFPVVFETKTFGAAPCKCRIQGITLFIGRDVAVSSILAKVPDIDVTTM